MMTVMFQSVYVCVMMVDRGDDGGAETELRSVCVCFFFFWKRMKMRDFF